MVNVGSNTPTLGMGAQLKSHCFPPFQSSFIRGDGSTREVAKISTGNRPRRIPLTPGFPNSYIKFTVTIIWDLIFSFEVSKI